MRASLVTLGVSVGQFEFEFEFELHRLGVWSRDAGAVYNSHVLEDTRSCEPDTGTMDLLLRHGQLYGQSAYLWRVSSAQATHWHRKKVSKRLKSLNNGRLYFFLEKNQC